MNPMPRLIWGYVTLWRMADDKNESPPSTMNAIGAGLNTSAGSGPIERYGPAIFGVLYVVGLILPAFVTIPNQVAYSIALGVIGPVGLAWIAKLGATDPATK